MSWKDAWDEGRTPWDAGASPPVLEKLRRAGELPEGRVLVPGCGAGYDVLTLAGPERHVVGLDLAPGAVEACEARRVEQGFPAEHAQFREGNFFQFEPDEPFDLVVDYTFLCAIEPDRRVEWARKMAEVIVEGGELLTVIFPVVDKPADEGPPYPLSPELVWQLLKDNFEQITLRPIVESNPGREGKEWLGRWRRV